MNQNPPAPDTSHESFESFDLSDETQILEELAGRSTDQFIYSFPMQGKTVVGLSYAGVLWACREYAKQGEAIRVKGHPQVMADPFDPDNALISVIVERVSINKENGKPTHLDSEVGTKSQPRFMKKKKYDQSNQYVGEEKAVDPFWYEKGVSKASRNGKKKLIPNDFQNKLIAMISDPKRKGGGAVKKIEPQAQAAPPPSAPKAPASPPPAAQAPAAPPPPTPAPPAQKPAAASAPASPDKIALLKKLDAVARQVFGFSDGAQVVEKIRVMTGSHPSEFSEEQIKKIGTLLQGVAKKVNRVDGDRLIRIADGALLLGAPLPVPQTVPLVVPDTQEKDMF